MCLPQTKLLASKVTGEEVDFVDIVLQYRRQLSPESNKGELAAFIAFAQAFPTGFLALVDTYDTLRSGIPNFLAVALALNDLGYKVPPLRGLLVRSWRTLMAGSCRLWVSAWTLATWRTCPWKRASSLWRFVTCRSLLSPKSRWFTFYIVQQASAKFGVDLAKLTIVASNDINEAVLYSLKSQVGLGVMACSGCHALTSRRCCAGSRYRRVRHRYQPGTLASALSPP